MRTRSGLFSLAVAAALAALLFGCSSAPQTEEARTEEAREEKAVVGETALVATARGEIAVEIDSEAAPRSAANFIRKASEGFYDGKVFHRVEDWVVQGGDPLGDGTGGGDQPTELSDRPFREGSVGVARGADIKVSNDSQFFICTKDCSWLTGQYTYLGRVISGMDAARTLGVGDEIGSINIKQD